MLRRFLRDRDGNIAMIFAIAMLPVILAAGAVADYTKLYNQQEILQDALDAAALAANRKLGVLTDKEVEAEALAYFKANTDGKVTGTPPLTVKLGKGSVDLWTNLTVPTHFLGIIGINEHELSLHARSIAGDATFEVVMVLDNSGSMAGSKISSLKKAAEDLSDALFEVNLSNPNPDPIKIGIVPFAAAVNVGAGHADASWIDGDGKGTYHSENFEKDANRFDLFDDLDGITWQGCVEARPHPYDVDDTAPDASTPATLFVPMFAPDESDEGWYSNDYIDDDGGSCEFDEGTKGNGKSKGKGKGKGKGKDGTSIDDLSDAERQALVCKYKGESLSFGSDNGVKFGPNINCTAVPLMPISADQSKVDAMISTLKADGLTNIHAGVMWGWRLLSPGAPFTDGRAYDDDKNRKILIVMTDGMNTYNSYDNFNKSMYGAFGYIAKDHLGTTSSNNGTVIDKMDERTLEACTNAKKAGILVYTIAFQVKDKGTLDMLSGCATSTKMAFKSESNSDLVAVFNKIAEEISLLRLEK